MMAPLSNPSMTDMPTARPARMALIQVWRMEPVTRAARARKIMAMEMFHVPKPQQAVEKQCMFKPAARPPSHAHHRGELQLPEQNPGAESQQQHGQRRENLQEHRRRKIRMPESWPGWARNREFRADPPEIHPSSRKCVRQPGGGGHERAELGVVGPHHIMRLEGLITYHRQRASQKGQEEDPTAALDFSLVLVSDAFMTWRHSICGKRHKPTEVES